MTVSYLPSHLPSGDELKPTIIANVIDMKFNCPSNAFELRVVGEPGITLIRDTVKQFTISDTGLLSLLDKVEGD